MKCKIILTAIATIISPYIWGQYVFDTEFCEYYGSFEPFNYDEGANSFTINLSETCDDTDGAFHAKNLLTEETDNFQTDFTYELPNSTFMEGIPYHYCFSKQNGVQSSNDPKAAAYFGIKLNHDEQKGRLLILINDELLADISPVLEEYKMALRGDGWRVSTLAVSSSESVVEVKQMVQDLYGSTGDLRSIFIIGEVPIPYSGVAIYPDGHPQHSGAWMADVYYADLDGVWTDMFVSNTSSIYERHQNVPGDGKFDQTYTPSPTELEIGRIYFENLPMYTEEPSELYERYLQKNINYRTGVTQIENEIILQSQNVFPVHMEKDLWLLSGAAGLDRKFGQVENKNFRIETTANSYRHGFGDSFGSATSCNNIVTSNQFKEDSLQVSFITLSGSYFGNWSYDNNLLSAACASKGNTIAATWGVFTNPFQYLNSGQTFGFCHKMAMHGYTGGTFLNYEPRWLGFNGYNSNTVSNMLIGDPSLKTYVLPKVESLDVVNNDSTEIIMNWAENISEPIVGYNVYRAAFMEENFTKLNSDFIQLNSFADVSPLVGSNVYMVRAVRLDTSNVSTFYTYSTGVTASIEFQYKDSDEDGFTADVDCNDQNPDVNPDQQEVAYNGIDDDCDELTPDDDLDGDGFLLIDDCDDNNPDINPDAEEIANNGIDEDCDGNDLISSIFELSKATLNIYPNPAIDVINIDVSGQLEFQVTLFDLQGTPLKTSMNSSQIKLESIPTGLYLIEIKDLKSGRKVVERIIIEN